MKDLHRMPRKASLFIVLSVGITLSVLLFEGVNIALNFQQTRAHLIDDVKQDLQRGLTRMATNVAPLVASYSVREYEKLLETEMALHPHVAIAVDNWLMARITGDERYLSGLIRDANGDVAVLNSDNPIAPGLLDQTWLMDSRPILAADGEQLGTVSIYASDSQIQVALHQALIRGALIGLTLSLLLAATIVLMLKRYFVSPMERFYALFTQRDEDGIPVHPASEAEFREIAALGNEFNSMVAVMRDAREQLKSTHWRTTQILEGTRVGTWEWNVQSGETTFNERWAAMLGYTLAELQPTSIETWLKFVHPEDQAHSEVLLKLHFAGISDHYECEARMRHRNGHWIWVLDRGTVATWVEPGVPLMMYGTHQDITARKKMEQHLSLEASVYANLREGLIITNADQKIINANQSFIDMTGFSEEQLIGSTPRLFSSGRHDDAFYQQLWASISTNKYWSGEIWNRRKNGEVYPARVNISAVADGDGKVTHYIGLFTDISVEKKNEMQLQRQAYHDPLTGLPNRAFLRSVLNRDIARVHRHGGIIGVVFIDLDGFKDVNDRHGHAIGDQLLVHVSDRMQACLRDEDLLSRHGGDEFVALLKTGSEAIEVFPVVERLLDAACSPLEVAGTPIAVTASIGLAWYRGDTEIDADGLLREADHAMYDAKREGKNRYSVVGSSLRPNQLNS